jgi:hypothetical protein
MKQYRRKFYQTENEDRHFKSLFSHVNKVMLEKCSYEFDARAGKPFTDGEFFKKYH